MAIVDAFDDATILHDLTVYSKTKGIQVIPQCTKTIQVKACFKRNKQGQLRHARPARTSRSARSTWNSRCAPSARTAGSS